jgi:hypothetical protein
MLWDHYVFRRGSDANDLWDSLFEHRKMRLLYIAGSGFDVRAQTVMRECTSSIRASGAEVEDAKLVLIEFSSYRLDDTLQELTKQNSEALLRRSRSGLVRTGKRSVRVARCEMVPMRCCSLLLTKPTSFWTRVLFPE